MPHLDAIVANAMASWGQKLDANETAVFARQLEYIYTRTYDVVYPDHKARILIPVTNQVDDAAETYTYRQFDQLGTAKLVHNYAKDFPNVDILGKEFTGKIKSLGDSYQYSLQDLRAAARAGLQLEARKAMSARRAIEDLIESIACTGDTNTGLTGLANAPNILAVVTTTGGVTNYWAASGKTPAEINADVNKMMTTVFTTTKGVFTPDTLALDTASYAWIATTPYSPTYTTDSILDYLLKANPWLKTIEFWPYLNTAGSGSGVRALCYKKDPEVLELVISKEFEQLPPQAEMMAFKVPCHARCGGVKVTYPKAIAYMDGIQA